MGRLRLDPKNPPALTEEQRARLDALIDEALAAAARDDADNPPLSEDERERLAVARRVREVRAHSGLGQAAFARMFRIDVTRLRGLEQGRTRADSAVLAYLAVIDREPEAARRALQESGA